MLDRSCILCVPTWVQLPSLHPKFRSRPSLSKIGSLVGKPLRTHQITCDRTKLHYARILVEMNVEEVFPGDVYIETDDG